MADDFKAHALNTSHDFYELLSLTESATDSEIRSAYRKATLKYHPDKVGASPEALERWHLLQIAHEVLSDAGVRELYDNARRAREDKKKRDNAFEGRRKWMKEDLERRESGALKRKWDETEAEEVFERELRRIAEDGKRRRKEREEQLRKEAIDVQQEEQRRREGDTVAQATPSRHGEDAGPTDLDRSVTLRFAKNDKTAHIDKDRVISLFERFGPIEDAVLRDKKLRVDGEKHKQPYVTAVLVFKSIVGAHAAISDIPELQKSDSKTFGIFEQVSWAAGREPDCLPKAPLQPTTPIPKHHSRSENALPADPAAPATPQPMREANGGLKKVPSFASFRGTPGGTPRGPNSPSLDEITMIRLKNAERRRLEEKIRKEEAAAAAAEG
ncbi:hypothetical protein LTR85_008720 [Meristemomyces frigidus]|nr:hypothetical protein LTR85_008720 [Meristemomyces frigidus]